MLRQISQIDNQVCNLKSVRLRSREALNTSTLSSFFFVWKHEKKISGYFWIPQAFQVTFSPAKFQISPLKLTVNEVPRLALNLQLLLHPPHVSSRQQNPNFWRDGRLRRKDGRQEKFQILMIFILQNVVPGSQDIRGVKPGASAIPSRGLGYWAVCRMATWPLQLEPHPIQRKSAMGFYFSGWIIVWSAINSASQYDAAISSAFPTPNWDAWSYF